MQPLTLSLTGLLMRRPQLVSDGAKTEIQSRLAHNISLAGPDPSPNHMLPES